MKRRPGVYSATVHDFDAHPWARRMSMRPAQLACRMGAMRQLLRKTKGRGGWGTLYQLQRLGRNGRPEEFFKVGWCRRRPGRPAP